MSLNIQFNIINQFTHNASHAHCILLYITKAYGIRRYWKSERNLLNFKQYVGQSADFIVEMMSSSSSATSSPTSTSPPTSSSPPTSDPSDSSVYMRVAFHSLLVVLTDCLGNELETISRLGAACIRFLYHTLP